MVGNRHLIAGGMSLLWLSGGLGVWAAEQNGTPTGPVGQSPPYVRATHPSYFFRDPKTRISNAVDFSSFGVEFTVPVLGVRAEDLTVNGLAATQVTGNGAGPYTFTGFVPPRLGQVTVVLAPGHITRDSQAHPPFEGGSWSFRLFDPSADDDGDGLTNAQEIRADPPFYRYSDPTKVDTDDDGLPDAYEAAHPCLDAVVNEALPQDNYGVTRPGDDDTDHDGISNLDEFKRGTDPCQP